MKNVPQKIVDKKGNNILKFQNLVDCILRKMRKFFLNNKTSASEKNPFTEINIFNSTNGQLRLCFFYFLAIAICGYLAVMILSVPYRDDWYRYFWNSHVGGSEALRSGTALIEYCFYLSNVITDVAPFTQILSCIVLAYMACIFLKMLKIDTKNPWAVICFSPIVVNPYLLEIMLFRFDNLFITLSLLIVTISAYLSAQNKKTHFVIQSLLLFFSLFVYQVAISVYFTVLAYEFTKRIRSGKKFIATIQQMKYWFYTLAIAALGYAPFLKYLNYCKSEDGGVLALPYNFENIQIITNNVCKYFYTLYNDWSHSIIGLILLIMICIFVIKNLVETIKSTKSVQSILLIFLSLLILTLCPSGLYACLRAFKENELVHPRLICGIGVFISIISYEVYLLLSRYKITAVITKTVLCLITLWSLMFLNSAANITRENFRVRNLIEYDIAKDIFEMSEIYPEVNHFGIVGEVTTQASNNFFSLYPIMNRIFLEKFNIFTYYRLGFMHDGLKNQLAKEGSVFFNEPKYRSKKLIKKRMMYDLYILDNRIFHIVLKKDKNYEAIPQFIMKVGRE